jgi:hypothetical protein
MSDLSQSVLRREPTACAYCRHENVRLYWTGRRWICGDCWREYMGGEPPHEGEVD